MDKMYKIVTFKLKYFAFLPIKTHSITIFASKDIQNNVQGPLKLKIIRFVEFINAYLLDSSALYKCNSLQRSALARQFGYATWYSAHSHTTVVSWFRLCVYQSYALICPREDRSFTTAR